MKKITMAEEMDSNYNLRVALVCVVKNSLEYLPAFIAHNLKLFDTIFIVDHNSSVDLRSINSDRIICVRAEQVAFLQEEFTNLMIDHYRIRDEFDWLFILDVDEFLPFQKRIEFHSFLHARRLSKVVPFFWKNGAPVKNMEQCRDVYESAPLQFYKNLSATSKMAVNIRLLGSNFYVRRSSHHIAVRKPPWYMNAPLLRRKRLIKPDFEDATFLYHVVSSSMHGFEEKVRNFKHMLSLQVDVPLLGGRHLSGYHDKVVVEQWLWYIANYRERDTSRHAQVTQEDFEDVDIFEHLSPDEVSNVARMLLRAPQRRMIAEQTGIERTYIAEKSKENIFDRNQRWFSICDGRITLNVPG